MDSPGFIVLLAVAIIYYTHLHGLVRRTWRNKKLTDFVYRSDLEPAPGLKTTLTHDYRMFEFFDHGQDDKVKHPMKGERFGLEVTLFDYSITVSRNTDHNLTVLIVEQVGPGFPSFTLKPERAAQIINVFFGGQDIDFGSHPRFSREYSLKGVEEYQIRRLFTHEVLAFLEHRPGLFVQARGPMLLITQNDAWVPVKELNDFVQFGTQLYRVLDRGMHQNPRK